VPHQKKNTLLLGCIFCLSSRGTRTRKGIKRQENHRGWFLARWSKPVSQAQDGERISGRKVPRASPRKNPL